MGAQGPRIPALTVCTGPQGADDADQPPLPTPFPLERLLAVLTMLLAEYDDKKRAQAVVSSASVMSQIATLTQLGILARHGAQASAGAGAASASGRGIGDLDACKLTCLVPFEAACAIADNVGVPLRKFFAGR